jgi:hypothetical protein
MWLLHEKDGLTMIESYFNPGDCLAVVPPHEEEGRRKLQTIPNVAGNGLGVLINLLAPQPSVLAADMCNGSVGLVPCNNPAAQWIFNGANLISALCWKNGISSFLTVNEECSELSVMAADGGNDALLRSQTFMLTEQDFIKTIVPVSTDEDDSNTPDDTLGYSLSVVGALPEPGEDSGPVIAASCNPTCENGKVCAKHSSNEAGGKCYTKCSNDAETGRRCETPNETCVHHYSHETGITSWCGCEGKGYQWMCMAK